jgi:hypothetical protein
VEVKTPVTKNLCSYTVKLNRLKIIFCLQIYLILAEVPTALLAWEVERLPCKL